MQNATQNCMRRTPRMRMHIKPQSGLFKVHAPASHGTLTGNLKSDAGGARLRFVLFDKSLEPHDVTRCCLLS